MYRKKKLSFVDYSHTVFGLRFYQRCVGVRKYLVLFSHIIILQAYINTDKQMAKVLCQGGCKESQFIVQSLNAI